MKPQIKGISSMATRAVLADLVLAYPERDGASIEIESVGGVDAAKRVQAGEAFDLVFLAADVIDRLISTGHLHAGRFDLVRSGVAVAVQAGAPRPDISSAAAVRAAVLAARTIGYSTGPSGVALKGLFQRWGIFEQIESCLVTAPPGVPVGALVARGEIELGFQQLAELLNVPGIDLLGPLPAEIQITTVFSAGIGASSAQADAVRALLDFMTSPAATPIKQRHGMDAAS
jgi:molybdate transport system substrate-binding protein